MDPVKNRAVGGGRRRFFICFNPLLADDRERICDPNRLVRKKKRARRGFSGTMKAVFLKSTLPTKVRDKKSRKDSSSRSSRDVPFVSIDEIEKRKNSSIAQELGDIDHEQLIMSRTDSNASMIFSLTSADSSTCLSSASSNSRSESDRIRPSPFLDHLIISRRKSMKRKGGKLNNKTVGVLMFMVCLVALVFWGKVMAIVACTSAWLFFPPRREHRPPCSIGACTNNSGTQ